MTEELQDVDLHKELGDIWEKSNAEEAERLAAEEAAAAEAAAAESSTGADTESTGATDETGPNRDERGRFKAKEGADDATKKESLADDSAATGAETAPQPLDAPSSWSAEGKAAWPTLPVELQNEILKREGDWQKADTERTQRLKAYEPIGPLIQKAQQIAPIGTDPLQYLDFLANAAYRLSTQPNEAFRELASHYGVDLSKLTGQQDQQVDPALSPVLDQMTALQQQVSGLTQQQLQAQQSYVGNAVQRFFEDPANEYAPRLEEQILAEINVVKVQHPTASPEECLKIAYDRAVRLDDGIQAEIAAKKAQTDEAQRVKEAEEKAANARRISATNLSSKGTSGGATPKQYANRQEELGDIYDQVAG